MTRANIQFLLSASILLNCLCPAQAASPATTTRTTKKSAGSSIRHCLSEIVRSPVTLTSFATGEVFGTPIAVVRKWKECTVTDVKSMCGEKSNPLMLVPAVPVGIFFGTIGGIPEGLSSGMADAWGNSDRKPFGKETFSLGDIGYPQDPVIHVPRWTYLF